MQDAIQIAGIRDREEAERVIASGAEFIGFPLRLKDGREDLSEAAARDIVKAIGERARSVVITYLFAAHEIIELTDFLGVGWVQLHGPISQSELEHLRRVRPGLEVIKTLVVRGGDPRPLIDEMNRLAGHVEAFITDTFDAATGRTGATGKVHDWNVSAQLVRSTPRPVILAGGLGPENVAEAIRVVRPAAVDAHTGVEDSAGRKDPVRLRSFVEAAHSAFQDVSETQG
ncbi:MAG: phosphoribosylanthranilate isomerase [Pseudomonadales bacterium]